MKRFLLSCAIAAAAVSAPASALSQGGPDTIARGNYVCELPGDAAGATGIVQPGESFSIESASRYVSAQGSGTYLRRGDQLIMTSGPRNGDTYKIVSRGFLRKIVDGTPSRMRCVRQGR